MAYPPVSPYRARFDDNPFEKFRIQRTDRAPMLGSNTATGYRSRRNQSKVRMLRFTLLGLVIFMLLILLWQQKAADFLRSQPQTEHVVEPVPHQPPEIGREETAPTEVGGEGTSPIEIEKQEVPPSPPTTPRVGRENASLVMLVRNQELKDALLTMKQIEDRFNRNFNYPWTFLNDEPFTDEFKEWTTKRASSPVEYGLILEEHWSLPSHIDETRMDKALKDMEAKKIVYGGSISYRHMCRYNSGFFWRHELLLKYDWYWRVEPSTGFFCDQDYDPFTYMRENKKKYGFVMTLPEYGDTIETLWPATREFIRANTEYIAENNSLGFIVDNDDGLEGDYNLCHFWSNFEIGDLNFYRSEAYTKYFEFLDEKGGFFYERWGDAPVHSLAAALFLNKDELHWFHDIGYFHTPWGRCPKDKESIEYGRCVCPMEEKDDFDTDGYSCLPRWWKLNRIDPARYGM